MKISLCLFCSTPVKRGQHWTQFCSEICEFRQWKIDYPNRSERIPLIEPCYYCGLPGITVDHIPPTSFRERLADMGLLGRYPFIEVRACTQCNSWLGAKHLFTPAKRKAYIKKRLWKKYRRHLTLPQWSDSELAQIGYVLRTKVLSSLEKAELIKARLDW